ncbi:F-box/kelch-repeat protein At3g23880-like [Vicia villosa]|uniref:F-box/kelch-repeat protein At3g23880-like n=1 Tax=Vicia villosa TaxID=3911 RepID=UPI00273A9FAE|nr:F-box/kelch-repeat protein At3g23880-like [Vicia villosa]
MTLSSEADEGDNVFPSDSLTEETTAVKHLNSSIETPTSLSLMSLPTLPFEIVVEILSRLPVKFLLQLQCVCKSWKSLISDPKFAKKHLRHASQSLILTLNNPDFVLIANPIASVFTQVTTITTIQLEYPVKKQNHSAFIVGSCHGILCFAFSKDVGLAFLWNPSIRKFTILPSLEWGYLTSYFFSFGYDDFSDTYKVVAVCYEPIFIDGVFSHCENLVKVHTLGTTSWTRIQDFPHNTLIREESGKFASGAINWLTYMHTRSSWVILSLDLEKEFYRDLPQPDYGGVNVVSFNLEVLRECLCIFSHTETYTDVWLMKEYGNKDSWTKLFRLPFTRIIIDSLHVSALYVSHDDQVLFGVQREDLIVYNSRDGTFKDPIIQNIEKWMDLEVYHESLISPCF